MPFPVQTFSTIQQLINYINSQFIPNGQELITGEIGNNVLNSLGEFIVSYTLNNQTALVHSTGGDFVLTRPITVFITSTPDSIQWPDNVQNEYYIVNATGLDIALATGFVYYDPYLAETTSIPARTVIHIAKSSNGQWMRVNNLTGGGSGNLPPQTGHEGEVLTTNGISASWSDNHISITSADFINATDCPLSNLAFNTFSLYWATGLANYIYEVNGEWEYLVGGGFRILIPGFDATVANERFELSLKGLNS